MVEAVAEQRAHLGMEFLPADHDARVAVVHVVPEFLGQVHRVDRHHHRVGAQDGVEGDDELRAVLHEQQHAVAAFHAAALLQKAGQRVRLALQFAVAQRRTVEDDSGFVRQACGGVFQIPVHAGVRQRENFRHAFWPEAVVQLHLPVRIPFAIDEDRYGVHLGAAGQRVLSRAHVVPQRKNFPPVRAFTGQGLCDSIDAVFHLDARPEGEEASR